MLRFLPDRCIACGSITRRRQLLPPDNGTGFTADGNLLDLPFWVCSEKCVITIVETFLPKRFHLDRTAYDDPDLPDDHIEEFVEQWNRAQTEALAQSAKEFTYRAAAAYSDYLDKLEEQEARDQERENRIKAQQEQRLLEQLKRDNERAERERRADERERIRQEERRIDRELRQTEHEERKRERELDKFEREWDRAHDDAHKEHELVLKQEEYENDVAPRPVPDAAQLENTLIVAGAGWGKTQLLQTIIAKHLRKPDPPSIIVLDSTGAIVKTIQHLRIFNEHMRDRIIIIDPADIPAPALNMLDFSAPRYANYTEDERENLETDIKTLFAYVFESNQYDLSGQMGLAFGYAVKLIMNRPHSTLADLKVLLEDRSKKWEESPFRNDIERLKYGADFFKNQFFQDALQSTRSAIARRIYALLDMPAFRRMFTAKRNMVDWYTEMNKGSIILVNTNLDLLKEDGMTLFGRYIIASTLTAAFERAAIPFNQRTPTFLVIDEAAPYFDHTFERLFTRARQFRLANIVAFQHLEQATDRMISALFSCTRIKYAAYVPHKDRDRFAKEMKTTPEFIDSMQKDLRDIHHPYWSEFACFVKPDFKTACRQPIQFYQMEDMPRMTDAQHQALLSRNKSRLTAPVILHDDKRQPQKPIEGGAVVHAESTSTSPHETPVASVPKAPLGKSVAHPAERNKRDPGEPSENWGLENH
jgi:hypothetical protein